MRTVSTLFSKKFLGAIFSKIMKTHARVEVRKTGEKDENRDLEHGKVFRKNQKSAQKRFFRRAARLFFENSALCPALCRADLSRPAYTVPAPLSRRSDSGQGTPIVC